MWEVSGTALDRAACGLQVDPEEVSQERLLEVAVDVRVIDDPQQLVDGHNRLTHRLDESILALRSTNLATSSCAGI